MLTALEQETFRDGFRLCLLVAAYDAASGTAAYRAVLFDGGRETAELARPGFGPVDAEPYLALRSFLAAVAAPPHVLAGAGNGWRRIAADALSERLPLFRVFDLAATARAFRPSAKARDGVEGLSRAHGQAAAPADSLASNVWADLLWAVVREAGTRGLDWPGLLAAADSARARPDFSRCRFDEVTLASLPESPGVYVMRDADGRPLYVGQSGNLRRRMREHFQGAFELPGKACRIRERARDIEFHPVGSELEALLLEERLIRELAPDLNVQRTVAEEPGRYGTPLRAEAILARSVRPDRVEIFALVPGVTLLQLGFRPTRAPARLLERLARFLSGAARRAPRAKGLTDWGARGAEIAVRHLGRGRSRLRRCPVGAAAAADAVATWLAAARETLEEPPQAEEWRSAPQSGAAD